MKRSDIVLIDCEDIIWNGNLLLPFWVVFDSKYKFRLSVKRDKDVDVCIMEADTENDINKPLDTSCYKFTSYEVWANGRYYHIDETLVEKTDRLRFINIIAKGNGHARIIFEQISNDNKLVDCIDLNLDSDKF